MGKPETRINQEEINMCTGKNAKKAWKEPGTNLTQTEGEPEWKNGTLNRTHANTQKTPEEIQKKLA